MIRTQIYLTEREHQGISDLARSTRKTHSELIRVAIDEFLTRKTPGDKLTKIRAAKGIWKDRSDMDIAKIRATFDRFP